MPDPQLQARIVLTTAANQDEAERLGRTFVEEQLAACTSLIPNAHSIYRWKGEVESTGETVMLIKTSVEQLAALEKRLHELHSYETPEFLVLPVEAASRGYLEWLKSSVQRP